MAGRPSELAPSVEGGGRAPDEGAASGERPIPPTEPSATSPAGLGTASRMEPVLDSDRFLHRGYLGRGSSGVVIRALDPHLLREVAIKVLDPALEDASEVDRFAEEARINGQLEHPNIVPVYEVGVDRRGRRFLCMKLIDGRTLEEDLIDAGESRLAPPRLAGFLQVFVKVCDAVSFAHSRGVIHRDLKPTNVMVSEFGQVYVLDWGIARLCPPRAGNDGPRVRVSAGLAEQSELDPPGSLVGTACYMAPEQLRGMHDRLDERTDVFALGATLYQILTGQPPLDSDAVRAICVRRPPRPIVSPDALPGGAAVPPDLARVAMRALAFDPTARYQSVADLQRDVEAFQRGAWDLPRVCFSAGDVILQEGDPGNAAYVIVSGRCLAYRVDEGVEIALRMMGAGDVFGEMAIFSERPRTASIRAETDVELLMVTREVLSKSLGLGSFMGGFVKALADRFLELDARVRSFDRRPTSR
jgi:serine/threonine-protein kinase